MYDSVTPSAIPATATMVAGYVDGIYAWPPSAWARFPRAVHVPIAVFASTNAGVVLDVETGDATPAQAPGWVQRRRTAGVDPTVYCNLGMWPAVRRAFDAAQVPQPHYWIARYSADQTIPAGAVAVQYADPPASGGQWDISAVADYWPGVDQAGGAVSDPWAETITFPNGKTFAARDVLKYADIYAGEADTKADTELSQIAALAALVQNLSTKLDALTGRVAGVLAAVQAGGVDAHAFAAALAPLLPAPPVGAVADATVSALAARLAIRPGGTT